MTKKLIALVEVLMVISLFCTGYATWLISAPTEVPWDTKGTISVYDVEQLEQLSPAYFGIALSGASYEANASGGYAYNRETLSFSSGSGYKLTKSGETFRYSTATTNTGSKNSFTNTSFSIMILVDSAVMAERITSGDHRTAGVKINCSAQRGNGQLVYPIAGFSNIGGYIPWEKQGLVYSKTCQLTLSGYPNLYIMADVVGNTNGSLDITIPVEQIYNLAAMNKLSQPTFMELEIEFSNTGYTVDPATPCGYTPTFTIRTVG